MNNLTKMITCLCVGIMALSAETLTFDGTQESLGGFINIDFKNGYKIERVRINNNQLDEWCKNNNKEFKEITLVIPGSIGNDQIYIGEGAFSRLQSDKLRLKLKFQNTNVKVILPENCRWLFAGSSSLTDIDLRGVVSNAVYTVSGMFSSCHRLKTINFANFNTSNIRNMKFMFAHCSSLEKLDLSMFDTHLVFNMTKLFLKRSDLAKQDRRSVDARLVKDTKAQGNRGDRGVFGMFNGCTKLREVDIKSGKFTLNKEKWER